MLAAKAAPICGGVPVKPSVAVPCPLIAERSDVSVPPEKSTVPLPAVIVTGKPSAASGSAPASTRSTPRPR